MASLFRRLICLCSVMILLLAFPSFFSFAKEAPKSLGASKDALVKELKGISSSLWEINSSLQKQSSSVEALSAKLGEIASEFNNINKRLENLEKKDGIVLDIVFPLIGVLIGSGIGYWGVRRQIQVQARINYLNTLLSFSSYRTSYSSLLQKIDEGEQADSLSQKDTIREDISKRCQESWFEFFFTADEKKKSQFTDAIATRDFPKAKRILVDYTLGK